MNLFFILFLTATFWTPSYPECSAFEDYDYILGRNAPTYDIAKNKCKSLDAELVMIYNETLFDHIVRFIEKIKPRPCSVWIGLRRNPSNLSNFIWDDGTPLGEFNKWSHDDGDAIKNQKSEQCVVMGFSCVLQTSPYNWLDITCNGLQTAEEDYLCQKPSNKSTDCKTSTNGGVETTSLATTTTNKTSTTNATPTKKSTSKAAPTTTKKTSSGPSIYIIIGAAGGGAVVIVFLIVLIVLLKRRKRKNDENQEQDSTEHVSEEHTNELEEATSKPNESNYVSNNQNTDHEQQLDISQYIPVDELEKKTGRSKADKISVSNGAAVYSVIDKKTNKSDVETPEEGNFYNTVNASEPSYDVFVRNGTVSSGSVEGTYNTLQYTAPTDEQTYNTAQSQQISK